MLSINDNIVRFTVKLWAQVAEFKQPADVLLSSFFRENRRLGVKERNIIAETIYTILRNYNKLTAVIQPQQAFMLVGYTWLRIMHLSHESFRGLKTLNFNALEKLPLPSATIVELPQWIKERLVLNFSPSELKQLADSLSLPAAVTLRVNTLKTTRDALGAQLAQMGIKTCCTTYSPYGLKLFTRAALQNNELFKDGYFEIQDEASQLAGMLLAPRRGEMIADFCAGSGGKTLLFGMLMRNSGRIYALDVNERRLGNLTPRLARSGLSNVYPQLINNESDTKVKRLSGKMNRVFVDAPCLGLGTLRRNPDLKFRHNETSLIEINQKQSAILSAASKLVKSDGFLVYATCSILREENQDIVEQFLQQNPQFTLIKINAVLGVELPELNDSYFLQLYPHKHDCDGFFACVMHKK
jgi:16S rRNA (cytosine967-C5)-methyltransferase